MFASEANRTTLSTAVPQKASQQAYESQKYKQSKTDNKGAVLKVQTSLDS